MGGPARRCSRFILFDAIAKRATCEGLDATPFFSGRDSGLIEALIDRSEVEMFQEGDDILLQDDKGEKMYYLHRGSVASFVDGVQVAVLHRGSIFGEMALLGFSKRTATVRAQTLCDCRTVSRDVFNFALKAFPKDLAHFSDMKTELQKTRQELQVRSSSSLVDTSDSAVAKFRNAVDRLRRQHRPSSCSTYEDSCSELDSPCRRYASENSNSNFSSHSEKAAFENEVPIAKASTEKTTFTRRPSMGPPTEPAYSSEKECSRASLEPIREAPGKACRRVRSKANSSDQPHSNLLLSSGIGGCQVGFSQTPPESVVVAEHVQPRSSRRVGSSRLPTLSAQAISVTSSDSGHFGDHCSPCIRTDQQPHIQAPEPRSLKEKLLSTNREIRARIQAMVSVTAEEGSRSHPRERSEHADEVCNRGKQYL